MTFIAQYRSECASCGVYIQKGDEAQFVAFDEVVHVVCPTDTTTLQREVCPHCFLEVPVNQVCDCRE